MFFQKERSGWWMASIGVMAGLSSILTLDGEQYATMHGISLTPRWCVASQAAGMRWWLTEKLFSGPAQEQSCWTISSVLVQRPPCRNVPIYPGTCTTVTTPKMWASPAHCRDSSRNTFRSLPWVRRGRTNLELVYMMEITALTLSKGHFNTNCIQITQMTVSNYIFDMHIKHFKNEYMMLKIFYVFVFCFCPNML